MQFLWVSASNTATPQRTVGKKKLYHLKRYAMLCSKAFSRSTACSVLCRAQQWYICSLVCFLGICSPPAPLPLLPGWKQCLAYSQPFLDLISLRMRECCHNPSAHGALLQNAQYASVVLKKKHFQMNFWATRETLQFYEVKFNRIPTGLISNCSITFIRISFYFLWKILTEEHKTESALRFCVEKTHRNPAAPDCWVESGSWKSCEIYKCHVCRWMI